MERQQVIDNIRQVAACVLPKGSRLYLYGSRARGDYHEDSDWDLLLLLDKPHDQRQRMGICENSAQFNSSVEKE